MALFITPVLHCVVLYIHAVHDCLCQQYSEIRIPTREFLVVEPTAPARATLNHLYNTLRCWFIAKFD